MVIVIIVVVAAALVVAAAWWIAQPKRDERVLDAEAPLPLFSSRVRDGTDSDRGQPHVEPAEVAMLRRGRLAGAQLLQPPGTAGEGGAWGPVHGVGGAAAGGNGYGTPALTPTAPQQAVSPDVAQPPLRPQLEGAFPPGLDDFVPAAAGAPLPPGTVQFLPGRLEVVQGLGVAGQEVRFVRPPPGEPQEVTFGRGEGPPYSHVQLRVPTVSRLHARLSLRDGDRWVIENLSGTNPVVVNGEELSRGASPLALADGDRIEMGEVVFRFRSR
ncbi:MAG: FHA domain-containing protein [Gemmatimonadaceae bacterium]